MLAKIIASILLTILRFIPTCINLLQLYRYLETEYIVKNVKPLSLPGQYEHELLVCTGEFNGIVIYCNGERLVNIPTATWVNCMSIRNNRILVGTVDQVCLYSIDEKND